MKSDDRIYGVRSAIQKAVRRGDLNLAYTAFEFLWSSSSVNRNWLKWRMVSIVQEEVLPMLGELPSLYKEGMSESAWRKFTYRLTLAPKNKDAEALRWLATYTAPASKEHTELSLMREWLALALSNPSEAASRLLDEPRTKAAASKYVNDVMEALNKRASQGGILEDRVNSIAAMLLLRTRSMREEAVSVGVGRGLQWFSDKIGGVSFSPKKVSIPWYCWDMHTSVGKIVLASLAKKLEMKREEFSRLWFFCESARTLRDAEEWRLVENGPVSMDAVGVWDSVWWKRNLSEALKIGEWTPRESIENWKKIRPDVKSMVQWLLKKRGAEG